MISKIHYKCPVGMLCIEEEDGVIIAVYHDEKPDLSMDKETTILGKAVEQLEEYFQGTRKQFDLPLQLRGTDFQLKVWKTLQIIPYGKTYSYGEIAKKIGNSKASRAVGGANNKNPILIIVPCHRVIGANGSMVGFAAGIGVKEYLLNLERQ
nr:methylated-DNA--[protein]-cysteine S-methyltransferase [uncultured Anaerosporobacter sp.]